MHFKTLVSLTALLLPLGLSAQQQKFDSRQLFSQSPAHVTVASNNVVSKSTANASRLVAMAELLYDPGTSSHIYDDSANLTWSNDRGGDLNSKWLKYDQLVNRVNNMGNLENNAKFTQTFDGNDNVIEAFIQSWNGTSWVDSQKTYYTYDGNNNMLKQLMLMWNGSSMDSLYKYTYTYDLNNNQISEVIQLWMGVWTNSLSYNNTYDQNGNRATNVLSTWNGSSWDSVTRKVYVYNTSNLVTSETTQNWNGVWENDLQMVYTYDGNNNLLTSTGKAWNGTSWDDDNLMTNTIQNNNIVTTIYQSWFGSWLNDSRFDYTYDGNHNQLTEMYQYWSNNWINSDKTEMTYNSYDQMTSSKDFTWINNAWDYEHEDSWARFYYEDYTNDVKDRFVNKDVKVYPVPARNYVNVEMDFSGSQAITLAVLDMNGRQVRAYADKASGMYKRTIDVNQLAGGNYLLKISSAGGKVSYGRFSVVR